VSAAIDVAAGAADKAALSWATDALPSCLVVAGDKEMCTWHTSDGENMICAFGPTGEPLIDFPCMLTRDNTDMATWPADAERWGDEGDRAKAALIEAAKKKFEQARTLFDMISLVGRAPDACVSGGTIYCTWSIARRAPGYITLARAEDASGKRLRLSCQFPSLLEPRGADSCRLGLLK
jgi:hypothetical protein